MWQPIPPPKPQPSEGWILKRGPIELHVKPAMNSRETWQSITIQFGRHSSSSESECCDSWPTLAISEARAALDDLERYLERNQ